MTDKVRIKSRAVSYRRAGLAFSSADWAELEAAGLAPRATAALLADCELMIEIRIGDDWVPLSAEERELAAANVAFLTEQDWTEVEGPASLYPRTVLDQGELERLSADAETGRNFSVVVAGEADRLADLGFGSERQLPSVLVKALIDTVLLRDADANAANAKFAEVRVDAELGADLSSAIAASQELLDSLGLWPVEDPARFFVELVNRLVARDGEIDRLKNTTADVQEGGGAGDGAGPAGGEQSQQEGLETVGNTSQAGATTPPAEPAPTPKRKPPAKGKPGDSKPS